MQKRAEPSRVTVLDLYPGGKKRVSMHGRYIKGARRNRVRTRTQAWLWPHLYLNRDVSTLSLSSDCLDLVPDRIRDEGSG